MQTISTHLNGGKPIIWRLKQNEYGSPTEKKTKFQVRLRVPIFPEINVELLPSSSA